MKSILKVLLGLALLVPAGALAADTGGTDLLRLSDARLEEGHWKVAVHVENSQELAGMDIPIRFGEFGDPVELVRVEFSQRVADWDFTYAQIDNRAKTVILGLISELVNMRPAADMKVSASGATKVADLVFQIEEGFQPEFAPFTTESPGHELTYLYNRMADGEIQVAEIKPAFEALVSFKNSVLPEDYALSQNFPNPFNPQTSFTLSLPEASDYSVRIFNVAGQLVRNMAGHLEAGRHTITWDGKSDHGRRVASGAYFYRAEAGGFKETRKMMMLK